MSNKVTDEFKKIHRDKQLVINTDGWLDVTCDKCKTITSFDPTVEFKDMFCLECTPSSEPKVDNE